jgi:hypothetical protein
MLMVGKANMEAQTRKQNEQHNTVTGMLQLSYFGCMKYLSTILSHSRDGLEVMRQIL